MIVIDADDRMARDAHPLIQKLVVARPLPVDAVNVGSSEYLNRNKKGQWPHDNATARRCGDGDPPRSGCVVIGTQLLQSMDSDALAGLIAHELGHIEAGHHLAPAGTVVEGVRLIGQVLSYIPGPVGWAGAGVSWAMLGAGVGLKAYSRDNEREADALAAARLEAAGYCAGPVMQKTFAAIKLLAGGGEIQAAAAPGANIFSTHPSLEERWKNAGESCSGPK